MSDELRHHCETTVAFLGGRDRMSTTDLRNLKLAKGWLAEHPADDGEPVTADWLLSAGFVADEYGQHVREVQIGYDCNVVGLYTPNLVGWLVYDSLGSGENEVSIGGLPTRGHVRRMCAALGITLTETPQ